jgi:molecular chaperone GrpE
LSDEAKPARKIKPPSASFLKSKEVEPPAPAPSVEVAPAEPAPAPSGELLGAPSVEAPPDQDLFVVPSAEPETRPDPQPAPTTPVSEAVADTPSARPAPAASESTGEPPNLQDRLMAELRELSDIVNQVEALSYLRSRVQRALDESQTDPLVLVSFYRLVTRSLSEQTDQARRDFEVMRSKANKLELELAAAMVGMEPSAAKPAAAAAAAVPPDALERISKLETEVTQANEQREKLLMDFKNMRERTQKDLDIRLFREKEKFFKSFLPVLDSFERAELSLNESSSVAALLEGFRLIGTQLMEALVAEGLEPVSTEGEFDPRFHEAVGEVHNQEKPDHHIYDSMCRGYRLGERLIRAAMVRISRNPEGVAAAPAPEPVADEEPPAAE